MKPKLSFIDFNSITTINAIFSRLGNVFSLIKEKVQNIACFLFTSVHL